MKEMITVGCRDDFQLTVADEDVTLRFSPHDQETYIVEIGGRLLVNRELKATLIKKLDDLLRDLDHA